MDKRITEGQDQALAISRLRERMAELRGKRQSRRPLTAVLVLNWALLICALTLNQETFIFLFGAFAIAFWSILERDLYRATTAMATLHLLRPSIEPAVADKARSLQRFAMATRLILWALMLATVVGAYVDRTALPWQIYILFGSATIGMTIHSLTSHRARPAGRQGRRRAAGPDGWRRRVAELVMNPLPHMLTVASDGQAIRLTDTNFWDTELAVNGYYYLSWNAGAGRLLVPDARLEHVDDMRSAHTVVVTRGPMQGRDMLEILFDDGSDAPFAIHLGEREQSDRRLPVSDVRQTPNPFVAWGRAGILHEWPSFFRFTRALPSLEPWRPTP